MFNHACSPTTSIFERPVLKSGCQSISLLFAKPGCRCIRGGRSSGQALYLLSFSLGCFGGYLRCSMPTGSSGSGQSSSCGSFGAFMYRCRSRSALVAGRAGSKVLGMVAGFSLRWSEGQKILLFCIGRLLGTLSRSSSLYRLVFPTATPGAPRDAIFLNLRFFW